MTPELIGIILVCIIVVLLSPWLFSLAVDYLVPLGGAMFRRFFDYRWNGLLSTIADERAQNVSFDDDFSADFPAKLNSETAETPQPVAENSNETFTLGETTALARLVVAGKIGLTDAVKIGADARSGEKYQKRSREIKAMVEQSQNKYPQRTPEQEAKRKELGLVKP